MIKKIGSKILGYLVLTLVIVAAMYFVSAAVPLGPSSLTEGSDETQNETAYLTQPFNAYAGNVSEINMSVVQQTKHWQGVFGEITGTIVLDDADNWTLYDWPVQEPQGEIYATPNSTTPSWASIICFNFTGGYGGVGNLTVWEGFYNMTYNDNDGIDETFNMTQHPTVDIGDVLTIANDTCPSTYTHVSDAFQTSDFSELLLQDDAARLIFTTIIEDKDEGATGDVTGYDGNTHDFQMLLAEDGTGRVGGQINTDVTVYYFYVDIE